MRAGPMPNLTANEKKWLAAVNAWIDDRDAAPLAQLLRAGGPIPDDAREFLAELAEGKAKRTAHRQPKRYGEVDRSIAHAVFLLRDAGETLDAAYSAVAQQRGLTDDQVRGVVTRLARVGVSFENWKSWSGPDGRGPDWSMARHGAMHKK